MVFGVFHAVGCIIGNAPGKIVVSATIAGIGVALLMKAKKSKPQA